MISAKKSVVVSSLRLQPWKDIICSCKQSSNKSGKVRHLLLSLLLIHNVAIIKVLLLTSITKTLKMIQADQFSLLVITTIQLLLQGEECNAVLTKPIFTSIWMLAPLLYIWVRGTNAQIKNKYKNQDLIQILLAIALYSDLFYFWWSTHTQTTRVVNSLT